MHRLYPIVVILSLALSDLLLGLPLLFFVSDLIVLFLASVQPQGSLMHHFRPFFRPDVTVMVDWDLTSSFHFNTALVEMIDIFCNFAHIMSVCM